MAKTKEISRRIKSISSTKKITKAMEMVSAAKMRKAIDAVLKTRTYANLSWDMVLRLTQIVTDKGETSHPFLTVRPETKRVAVILISSNRGMCGAYNSAVISKVEQSLKIHKFPTDIIIIGKKGTVLQQRGHNIVAEFDKSDLLTDIKEIYPVIKLVLGDYSSGKYDKVLVAYTDFVNAAKQVPRLRQLLPVDVKAEEEYLGIIGTESNKIDDQDKLTENPVSRYKFEPNRSEVLNQMVPRLLEVQLYQAFLEANASEHSARMTAMHQATEAAEDMVSELTLFYNKARQASITAEIAEISAGANALAE
ncbi:ATP synthase F1 subunit gamma [Candidatus Falkowbacteria bacterium]|uniref:ATP synthase gamma chain n=1 Tax=Candidatus Falkowbacteria bacterium CG10_big_fil_rev_8_21_14_0_10_37_18 TaxID=1974562 RepID=A0A2H0V956_9BACT|nr:ATP synthase F1 subunit gamma [Candidatus Falkowbacteria bacterium]NCQ12735.1 ATP synthase F1 subunit gamma [Candidatus Falkowbacteria bacterium]OIO05372.1 MAG: ATP synthase F1 subunit gamma [Candidatus Falkowbacteria bacterium CG1_02_37_21]PIR95603.1 MAG: ATP synthase F1 subunit gamma [Candidatus Falkowbacteria bacterium CG10_big_fil_rev_8_21_14_0_10_37_18]